jgi:hypothetical protein
VSGISSRNVGWTVNGAAMATSVGVEVDGASAMVMMRSKRRIFSIS